MAMRELDPTLPADYVALIRGEREPRTIEHSGFKSDRDSK